MTSILFDDFVKFAFSITKNSRLVDNFILRLLRAFQNNCIFFRLNVLIDCTKKTFQKDKIEICRKRKEIHDWVMMIDHEMKDKSEIDDEMRNENDCEKWKIFLKISRCELQLHVLIKTSKKVNEMFYLIKLTNVNVIEAWCQRNCINVSISILKK
jgi:hypothetical protein